jgi:hypothetical protein
MKKQPQRKPMTQKRSVQPPGAKRLLPKENPTTSHPPPPKPESPMNKVLKRRPRRLLNQGGLPASASSTAVSSRPQQRAPSTLAVTQPHRVTLPPSLKTHTPGLAQHAKIGPKNARKILRVARHQKILDRNFLLIAADGNPVKVGDLLDHPETWHHQRFYDPLEPNDHPDSIAWANLQSGHKPYLYSQAHGGTQYFLRNERTRIILRNGDRGRALDQSLRLLRNSGEIYEYGEGGHFVRVTAQGQIMPAGSAWLDLYLDRNARFVRVSPSFKNAMPQPKVVDTPPWIGRRLLKMHGERHLPHLNAVITVPTLRLDGSILSAPGYDPSSGLLLMSASPALPQIPVHPNRREARLANKLLWRYVAYFPLVDDVDRGVILAAMLTAAVRATLPTAPGFGFDAPMAGTGKTLLACTIGALLAGESPTIMPPASANEGEARKRLFAALRDHRSTIVWDNIREPFGNAAIDAFLTAPTFTDRILGQSATASLPNRTLFLITGNHLRLIDDTCRRVLVARLDAKLEQPYRREFAFNPEAMVIQHRLELVVAALTLIRAWFSEGCPRHGDGRTASFEDWDDLVRQPVCWVATWALRSNGQPMFADPLKATERAFEQDPETTKLGALLNAWKDCFGVGSQSDRQTVGQLIEYTRVAEYRPNEARETLRVVLTEIAGEQGGRTINPRRLGRWIDGHAERRIGGLRFVQAGEVRHAKRWMVDGDDHASA